MANTRQGKFVFFFFFSNFLWCVTIVYKPTCSILTQLSKCLCRGFWNRRTIRFVFGRGVSEDSLRMVSYGGLEGGSEVSWLYWFMPES
jgi:hypothetical protein